MYYITGLHFMLIISIKNKQQTKNDFHKKEGSIINVGVKPLRCHLQHYFLQKNKHIRLTCFTIKVSKS